MTWLPPLISLIIIAGHRKFFINLEGLEEIEKKDVNQWLRGIFKPLIVTYPLLLLFTLNKGGDNFLLYRELYTSLVANNDTLLMAVCQTFGLLLALSCFARRKYFFWVIITFSLILLGKKYPIFLAFLLPFLTSLFYNKKIRKIQILIPSLIAVFGLWYISTNIFYDNDNSFIVQIASTFDYIYNFDFFIQNYKLGNDGGEIFLSSIYKFIPRIMWSDKPEIYGFLLIHQNLFPVELSMGYTPSTFETFSVWLADFGLIGIIFYSFFSGIWLCLILLKKIPPVMRYLFIIYSIDQTLGLIATAVFFLHHVIVSPNKIKI